MRNELMVYIPIIMTIIFMAMLIYDAIRSRRHSIALANKVAELEEELHDRDITIAALRGNVSNPCNCSQCRAEREESPVAGLLPPRYVPEPPTPPPARVIREGVNPRTTNIPHRKKMSTGTAMAMGALGGGAMGMAAMAVMSSRDDDSTATYSSPEPEPERFVGKNDNSGMDGGGAQDSWEAPDEPDTDTQDDDNSDTSSDE